MFTYGAEFFMMKPGLVLLVFGLLITLPLSFGSFTIGPITFDLYWMLFGLAITVIGLQSFFFGCLAQVFCDYTGKARRRWMEVFRYTRAVLSSLALCVVSLLLIMPLVVHYLTHNFSLPAAANIVDHLAVTAVLLLIGSSGMIVGSRVVLTREFSL